MTTRWEGLGLRIMRGTFVAVLSAWLVASPSSQSISDPRDCDDLPDAVTMQSVSASFLVDQNLSDLSITINGAFSVRGVIPTEQRRFVGPRVLCEASLGKRFTLNEKSLCGLFWDGFEVGDVTQSSGDSQSFVVHTKITGDFQYVKLLRPAGERPCSQSVSFSIQTNGSASLAALYFLPDELSAQEAKVVPADWAEGASISLMARVVAPPKSVAITSQTEPRSLLSGASYRKSIFVLATRFLAIGACLAGFWIVVQRLLEVGEQDTRRLRWLSPLLMGSVLGITANVVGESFGVLDEIPKLDDPILTPFADSALLATLLERARQSFEFKWLLGAMFLLALLLPLSLIYLVAAYLARRGPDNPFVQFGRCLVYGCLLALAGMTLVALVILTEVRSPIGYEVSAWLVSVMLAYAAVLSLRPVFGYGRGVALLYAIVAATSLLFPYSSVVRLPDSEPAGSLNALVWFQMASLALARMLYQGALLIVALEVARRGRSVGWTKRDGYALLTLMILSTASFGMNYPIDAIAVLGVGIVSAAAIFAPAASGMKVAAGVGGRTAKSIVRSALLTGSIAAIVFGIQVVRTKPAQITGGWNPTYEIPAIFGTFVTGTLAAMILGLAFVRIRGDSAVLKAVLVSIVIIATNIAVDIGRIMRTHDVLPAITEFVGVIAALLIVAVVTYDYAIAKQRLSDFTFREMFSGTTLEKIMPVVWGVGAALVSAITPIVDGEVKEAFKRMIETSSAPAMTRPQDNAENSPTPSSN